MTILSPSFIRLNLPIRDRIAVLNALCVPSVHIDVVSGCTLPGFLSHEVLQSGVLRDLSATLTFHIVPKPHDNTTALRFLQSEDLAVLHVFPTTQPQAIDKFATKARAIGCRVGLAIDLRVALNMVNRWLDVLDTIMIMGIPLARHGLQPDISIATRLDNAREAIAVHNPACRLALDGGVTASTFQRLIGCVDELVIGGLLFNTPNLAEQWRLLSEYAHRG